MTAQTPTQVSPTRVARLMVAAALSAVSCAEAIHGGDEVAASLHVGQLRSALKELERLAPGSSDVAVLRRHEARLSERMACELRA